MVPSEPMAGEELTSREVANCHFKVPLGFIA
jgi:hypothetical protein